MTETTTLTPPKKDRSPNFPFIPLSKAVERTRELFTQAKRHEARLVDVAGAWGLGIKSSTTLQTIGALLAYGLLEDSGSGESKKFKVSDLGWKALEDSRPGAKESALREAALKPKWIAEYAEKWKAGRPADPICISELKFDHGFTDEAAATFLKVFDGTIQFATPSKGDKVGDKAAVKGAGKGEKTQEPPGPLPLIKVGDYIQWTSGGQDQFGAPRRVMWISEDGTHLRVHGSMTGIPMNEAAVVDPPAPPAANPRMNAQTATPDINVLLLGKGRLEITANVDADGLKTLKAMLEKYEQILALLAHPTDQAIRPVPTVIEIGDEEEGAA
jgi:hypothetical protein